MILDTQFLGELVEQHDSAREKAEELEGDAAVLRVPSMVIWEASYGVGKAPEPKRTTLRVGYERLFDSLPVIDLNEDLARRAGELRGKHAGSDGLSNLDGADSVVAVTALSYGDPVLSNDADFEDVDGLAVETF